MIHFATKVLLAAVPTVVLIGCNPSQGGDAVDQAKVEAYFDQAQAAEVTQIIERKRLVEHYLEAADDAQIKAVLAAPDALERLLGAADVDRVLQIVGADAAVSAYLEAAEPAEVLALVENVREAVTRRFLTPDPALVEEYAAHADAADSGVCRLLSRGPFDGLTTGRGGGAYYSFRSRANDYNQQPDLQYQNRAFTAGFTRGHHGCVQPLEGVTFEDADVGDMTALMVTESTPELESDGRKPECRATAEVGKVYAVRSHHSNIHDTLVVMEVVAMDDHGVTIVWRTVDDWLVPAE